ncbi:ATV_HP_G0013810.mRNA.1.CDS.1 [Saccharomyces cerevisiae]|nr:ATV_HP_G0013810.mRNA.1.CDS.1 [Saccharomyces cerevisiae]CAI6948694.1 ATV_HP_G0013810.mRNA.1.CDS.1 [Saccharomyces cerevisiae]
MSQQQGYYQQGPPQQGYYQQGPPQQGYYQQGPPQQGLSSAATSLCPTKVNQRRKAAWTVV